DNLPVESDLQNVSWTAGSEYPACLFLPEYSSFQDLATKVFKQRNHLSWRSLYGEQKTKCDSGWKAFDGSCYFIDTTERNQDDAQATCKSMNSDLVIINSDREKNFIESITDSSSFWIGLKRDKNNKKEWRWVDGTYYYPSQRFWMNGEPNNESEECVHTSKEKKWNDIFCTYKYKAICEKK
ncbi:hypothetical protein XELAEV_18018916mg, partial [Xenopus laevis]